MNSCTMSRTFFLFFLQLAVFGLLFGGAAAEECFKTIESGNCDDEDGWERVVDKATCDAARFALVANVHPTSDISRIPEDNTDNPPYCFFEPTDPKIWPLFYNNNPQSSTSCSRYKQCVCKRVNGTFREVILGDAIYSICDGTLNRITNGYWSPGLNMEVQNCPTGDIVIPADVTSIADSAFSQCMSLTWVDFSQATELRSIGDNAFALSKNLGYYEFVTVPFENTAYYSCLPLCREMTFPEKLTTIGALAFSETHLRIINFPKTPEIVIHHAAFSKCPHLNIVEFHPQSNVILGGGVFFDSAKISRNLIVNFPRELTESSSPLSFIGVPELTLIYPYGKPNNNVVGCNKENYFGCIEIVGKTEICDCSTEIDRARNISKKTDMQLLQSLQGCL